MQVHTRKSSCVPLHDTPRVTQSTEGAKVARWRYNQSVTDLREGKPWQKTIKPRGGVGHRANHSALEKNSELRKPHNDKTVILGQQEETKSWITVQVTVLTTTANAKNMTNQPAYNVIKLKDEEVHTR